METKLKIRGMSCSACVTHVTNALHSVDGVQKAEVDLHAGEAVVHHGGASGDAMVKAVTEEGYEAEVL